MQINELPQLVLMIVLVGMLVGVGVLITDKFATAAADTVVVTNETIAAVPNNNTNITLAHGNLTSFGSFHNVTNEVVTSTNYKVHLAAGKVEVLVNDSGGWITTDEVYAYYSYTNYETEAATALDAARDAIGGIATSWLALIVTIAVLAILLVLVIRSFSMGSGRGR